MSIKVVIIDDEPRAIDLLVHYISQIDFLEIEHTFRSSLKAFQYLTTESVDLLFLDINMPKLSGIELFKNLKNAPDVIFTTAHPEFAINGFDLDAIDYLLKPITFSRFLKASQKAQKTIIKKDVKATIPTDSVYIKSGSISHKLFWSDIAYLKKDENYIIYYLTNGKRLLCRQTLSNMEKVFPKYVVRIHKSYAICMYHITSLGSDYIMVNHIKIQIGRNYKSHFFHCFDEYKTYISNKAG